MGKEHEVSQSAPENARTMYREVTEAATPLVDMLTPEVCSISHNATVDRLKRSAAGLKEYIRDLAGTCYSHLLSILKALYPKQTTCTLSWIGGAGGRNHSGGAGQVGLLRVH